MAVVTKLSRTFISLDLVDMKLYCFNWLGSIVAIFCISFSQAIL